MSEGKISWDVFDIDGDRFVCEKIIEGDRCVAHVHFGPLHTDAVGPFLDDRREAIEAANKGVLQFDEDAIWTAAGGAGNSADPFDAFLQARAKG